MNRSRMIKLSGALVFGLFLVSYFLLSAITNSDRGSSKGPYQKGHNSDKRLSKTSSIAVNTVQANIHQNEALLGSGSLWLGPIHVCVVICGERMEEALILLKSAALLTRADLVFHIFAEDTLHFSIKDQLNQWADKYLKKVTVNVYHIQFPPKKAEEWRKLFKLCAAQRLFLPNILTEVDALIYLDTDILLLTPADRLWHFFSKFNSTQFTALAPEHEDRGVGWYDRFAHHPYYGPLGINSGVMLMNLTRMREFDWVTYIEKYYKEYKLKISWGDQDLINIFFYFHPERLYIYPCEWNYRADHCMYSNTCHSAETSGIYVLHGSRSTYHTDKRPIFRAMYRAFKEHQLGDNLVTSLLANMKRYTDETLNTSCGKYAQMFISRFQKEVLEITHDLTFRLH